MGKKGFFRQWFDSLSEEEKTAYYVDQQDVNPSIILAKIPQVSQVGQTVQDGLLIRRIIVKVTNLMLGFTQYAPWPESE